MHRESLRKWMDDKAAYAKKNGKSYYWLWNQLYTTFAPINTLKDRDGKVIHDKKIVEHCRACNKELPLFSKHHFLCDKCWKRKQNKKNLEIKKELEEIKLGGES